MKVAIPLLLTVLAVAGCAGSGGGSKAQPATTTTTTSPAAVATPTTSAGPSATPLPPTVTVAEWPVIVVRSPNGKVAATTADGTFQWAFDPHTLGIRDPVLVTGGPNLLAIGDGRVIIIDRTGTVIGRATYSEESPMGDIPAMYASPTGTRWAWMAMSTAPSAGASTAGLHASSLWVAGLGERPHRVKTWTGEYDVARQWSDAGVVVVKLGESCGGRPLGSVLVDPATGAETQLFGADRWPLDVHAGVRVAAGLDRESLHVAGAVQLTRTYPLPIVGARVSPDGGRLFVGTFAEGGCGGRAETATHVLEMPSAGQTTIDGFLSDAWLDETHLLGRTLAVGPQGEPTWSAHVQVADLSGHTSDLVQGTLVGVLHP